jgi:hypothetical protein
MLNIITLATSLGFFVQSIGNAQPVLRGLS